MASDDATGLLQEVVTGRREAVGKLLPLVYDELRALAEHRLRQEPPSAIVQPTSLVHDVFLRMIDQSRVNWQGRTHFFAVAATMMRRVLVEDARYRKRQKRGGGWERVALDDGVALAPQQREIDVIDLDEALSKLAQLSPREAQVVELRFFAGLSVDEVAEALGVSPRTVDDDWAMAKAWLKRELSRSSDG